jgi:hypothetical protein
MDVTGSRLEMGDTDFRRRPDLPEVLLSRQQMPGHNLDEMGA